MVNSTLAIIQPKLVDLTKVALVNISSNSSSSLKSNLSANLSANISSVPSFGVLADPIFWTFSLTLIAIATVMIFVVKNIMPVSQFLYADARIQSRSAYMVSSQLLSNLADAGSLSEFKSLLRPTDYGAELDKTKDGLKQIQLSIEKSHMLALAELSKLSPSSIKPLLNSYFMLYEAKILKLIFRSNLMEEPLDESLVFPVGSITDQLLKSLIAATTVADISVVMDTTQYSKVFEKKYSSIEDFEVSLDNLIFAKIAESIKETRIYDGNFIMELVNKKIDISNLLALLKFRIRGVQKEKQKSLLISNGTELYNKVDYLIGANEIKEMVDLASPIYPPLKKAYDKYEKTNSFLHFETELYIYYYSYIKNNELAHTLGPYPIFAYLIKKEIELRNLFIISKGISAGIPAEKIKELIV